MPATFNIDQAKGKNASGPIIRRRFVKLDTAATDGETVKQCDTAGEGAYGVSLFSVSNAEILHGKGCSVITDGRAVLEAGGALAVGDAVATDNVGRAKLATTGQQILGYVDEPATALGNDCAVMLGRAGVSA